MTFETISLGTQPAGSGGDTARTAFEKVNNNFLAADVLTAAMSQAQFNTIREQNNESFAASGFVHFGKHINIANVYTPIKTGLYAVLSVGLPYKLLMGTNYSINEGNSKKEYAVINIAGVTYNANLENNVDEYTKTTIKFPQAPDGKTTYNKSTGVNIAHSTAAAAFNEAIADPTNIEVVTDRVDMWGFESWLEEVSETNPYIYPNGLIQSLATTMDGITTSVSSRPDTYYAWFNGDSSSKGKGVNYFTLTDAQKRKVLANYKNNLYFLDDGRLVQWRLRGRSIAGAGNGDWDQVDSTIKNALRFDSNILIKSQGALDDSLPANSSWGTNTFFGTSTVDFGSSEVGVFASKVGDTSSSVNGECYFLICGTVNRLNSGAYHPSFNPLGSRLNITDGQYWHVTTNPYTSTLETFTKSHPASGTIVTGSGRPDGRSHEPIYSSGQGGVCRDMRYSANGLGSVDFAEADSEIKGGKYRGYEGRVKTQVFQFTLKSFAPYAGGYYYNFYENTNPANYAKKGTAVYFPRTQKLGFVSVPESYEGGSVYLCNNKNDSLLGIASLNPLNTSGLVTDDVAIILHEVHYSSIGGSFLQTDVVGRPDNIVLTTALKSGWEGSWLGTGAGSGTLDISLSRKSLSTIFTTLYSLNNGASWSPALNSFNDESNKITVGLNDNLLSINQYQAFAKQTESSSLVKVHGVYDGIGSVFNSSRFATSKGCLLAESALGVILRSNISGHALQTRNNEITSIGLWETGWLSTDPGDEPLHQPISLTAPTNGNVAFKALDFNANVNQQGYKFYALTELIYGLTGWGDDGKVTIVNGESTKTDLNGNVVKVVTHKLKEPIGWIKNKV